MADSNCAGWTGQADQPRIPTKMPETEFPPPPEDSSPPSRPSLRDRRLERMARRTVEATSGAELSRLEEVFAIIGIVFGFLIFLTIPGWFGVRAWGRYKRGEESSIRIYEYMGFVVAALLALGVVVGVFVGD
jgi:amino acid transporter